MYNPYLWNPFFNPGYPNAWYPNNQGVPYQQNLNPGGGQSPNQDNSNTAFNPNAPTGYPNQNNPLIGYPQNPWNQGYPDMSNQYPGNWEPNYDANSNVGNLNEFLPDQNEPSLNMNPNNLEQARPQIDSPNIFENINPNQPTNFPVPGSNPEYIQQTPPIQQNQNIPVDGSMPINIPLSEPQNDLLVMQPSESNPVQRVEAIGPYQQDMPSEIIIPNENLANPNTPIEQLPIEMPPLQESEVLLPDTAPLVLPDMVVETPAEELSAPNETEQ